MRLTSNDFVMGDHHFTLQVCRTISGRTEHRAGAGAAEGA